MILAIVYSVRHLGLIFLAYFPLLPGHTALAFLKSALSPALVLADVPGFLLLLAWRHRRPGVAPFWPWVWRHGQVLLLLTLGLPFGLLLFTTALPLHLRHATGSGLLALGYLLLHGSISLYWLRSRRVRAVFRDFPVQA